MMEITKAEEQKKKMNLRDLGDMIKRTNISNMGVLEREEREKGSERIFQEIMAENFANLMRYININIQEAQ